MINSWPDWAPAYEERTEAYRELGMENRARADERSAADIRERGTERGR